MKTRKHFASARRLAITGAALAAGLASGAHAESGTWSMVVVEATQYSRGVMSHDWDRTVNAINKLEEMGLKTFNAYNNLCVGYTMTRAFDKAKVACDAALDAHDEHLAELSPLSGMWRTAESDRREAIALTNRGVLKAVSGDLPGARDDFTVAAGISGEVTAATANMERLSARIGESGAVAQVDR